MNCERSWKATLDVDKLTNELARLLAQTVEKRTAALTKERDDALKEIERLNGELRTAKFGTGIFIAVDPAVSPNEIVAIDKNGKVVRKTTFGGRDENA